MEKRKWSDRLQLLNGGRADYLNFLRNLTPQVELLSIVMILWIQLDFTRIDCDNTAPTFAFFMLLGAFMLAFYANTTLFYESCFAGLKQWGFEQTKLMTSDGVSGPRRLIVRLQAIWRDRLIEFMEATVVLLFLPIALSIVIVLALHSAEGIWRANHNASTSTHSAPRVSR